MKITNRPTNKQTNKESKKNLLTTIVAVALYSLLIYSYLKNYFHWIYFVSTVVNRMHYGSLNFVKLEPLLL